MMDMNMSMLAQALMKNRLGQSVNPGTGPMPVLRRPVKPVPGTGPMPPLRTPIVMPDASLQPTNIPRSPFERDVY